MIKRIPELSLVYGGQWGSEGKGQVLAAIARDEIDKHDRVLAVRVGAPNAGHTARFNNGKLTAVQSIPIPAFLYPDKVVPIIGAGGMVNLGVLEKETAMLMKEHRTSGWLNKKNRTASFTSHYPAVYVDPNTAVVSEDDVQHERGAKLQKKIGSTSEGVGAALARKIRRDPEMGPIVVKDYASVGNFLSANVHVTDTVSWLNSTGYPVWVEGTQGHLLSIHTSGFYPFCTSRECGPLGILSDIGLSPFAADRFRSICVFRTFPIRVGGNSGEMKNEIDWETLRVETNGYVSAPEKTTVTGRNRRIARWDMDRAFRTVVETRPTELAITFLDYLFPECANVQEPERLPECAVEWLSMVQEELGTRIRYVSTGPGQENCFGVYIA